MLKSLPLLTINDAEEVLFAKSFNLTYPAVDMFKFLLFDKLSLTACSTEEFADATSNAPAPIARVSKVANINLLSLLPAVLLFNFTYSHTNWFSTFIRYSSGTNRLHEYYNYFPSQFQPFEYFFHLFKRN